MNILLMVKLVVVFVLSACILGQWTAQSQDTDKPTRSDSSAAGSYKQELMHRIAIMEDGARQAEKENRGDVKLGRIYAQIGQLCRSAAQWQRAEAATEHSVSLFRRAGEPNGELAVALSDLGTLHAAMGKFREGVKEEQEALRLREKLGDRLQIARSWVDIAAISFEERKFERARDFSQKAMEEFAVNPGAIAFDRISARYGLGEALCSLKECSSSVRYLKEAVDEAKATMPRNNLIIAIGEFHLGYAYWKSGEISLADEHMRSGTDAMSEQLGWGHPAYLAALTYYARFLKENQQTEAANVVERRIRQAEAVVDVHAIQSGQGAFGFAALK